MPFEIVTAPADLPSGPREGRVDKIKFQNAENGYSILLMDVAGKRETWVGTMPHAFEGVTLRAEGQWETSKYGKQFKVGVSETPAPKERSAAIQFIAGLADGVGPKTAEKIYEAFGPEVWAVMEKTPARMSEVKGLSAKHADALCKAWCGQKDLGRIIVWLQGHGLGVGLANRIVKTYGGRAMEVVTKQPYRLAMDIAGIGFRKADEIARGLGIALTDPERILAGVLHVLEESFVSAGHCFAWDKDLVAKATEILSVGSSLVTEGLGRLEKSGRVVTEIEGTTARVFPKRLAETEAKVAWYLARLMKTEGQIKGVWCGGNEPGKEVLPISQAVEAAIAESEAGGMKLSDAQAQAVRMLATEKVMVLTGGPGCGKTACTKVILNALKKAGAETLQAAPTGKAAKRIRELTGEPASTIHSLLGYDPSSGKFIHNETNTLPIDALCLDESSMTDLALMRHVLAALHPSSRLVLVGDVDQLPSVSCGAVLRDVLESRAVPSVRLTQIFRQAAQSTIITNSHAINQGRMPASDDAQSDRSEFLIFPAENMDDPGTRVVEMATKWIPEKFGIQPKDIQVLCPKKEGKGGVNPLNRDLQRVLNPDGKAYRRGDTEFRTGDRVMHLKNDYARRVFNGDVGYVTEVFLGSDKEAKGKTDPVLRVQYDDVTVDYSAKQMHELTLAYACTVHKCLAPNTLVDTDDGLLPISMIAPQGHVLTADGVKPYRNLVHNPSQPTLRFVTRDGYRLETTLDHGMVVVRKGVPVEVEAQDVREGDLFRLPLGVHCNRAGGGALPMPTSGDVREKVYRTPDRMSVELAELLGLMLADGVKTKRGVIRLVKRHTDVTERFRSLFLSLFGLEMNPASVHGTTGYEICSSFMGRWLSQIGGLEPEHKAIPECIRCGSLEEQAAFLRGLFEDGSAHLKNDLLDHVEFTTEYADVAMFVRVVLLQLGIISGTTTSRHAHMHKVEIYGENAYRFGKVVGFISKFKQDRVNVDGGKDGYKIPLTQEEALALHPYVSRQERVTLRQKLHVRRFRARELVNIVPAGELRDALQDRLRFHYSPVVQIEPSESETMCIEVPEGHRFVQGGIDGKNCQGSQYSAIVMPVLTSQFIMLSRNLVYTGVTRAKRLVVLVAEQKAMQIALAETRKEQRNTRLAYRIQKAMEATL